VALDKLAKVYPPASGSPDVSATKREEAKTVPAETEVKPPPVESVPVAKNSNPGEVRTKRTREK
jgi:hypothetical protein